MKGERKMKKKFTVMMALALVMVSSVGAFAAAPVDRPASILEEVTGLTWDEIRVERFDNDKTAGQIAESVGKFAEYKAALVEFYTNRINADVEAGRLTADEARAKITEIKDFINSATAEQLDNGMALGGRNGGGMMGSGRKSGKRGSGMQNGSGLGLRDGSNAGNGASNGTGRGMRDGSNQGNGLANGTGLGPKDGTGPLCND